MITHCPNLQPGQTHTFTSTRTRMCTECTHKHTRTASTANINIGNATKIEHSIETNKASEMHWCSWGAMNLSRFRIWSEARSTGLLKIRSTTTQNYCTRLLIARKPSLLEPASSFWVQMSWNSSFCSQSSVANFNWKSSKNANARMLNGQCGLVLSGMILM